MLIPIVHDPFVDFVGYNKNVELLAEIPNFLHEEIWTRQWEFGTCGSLNLLKGLSGA